VSAQTEAEKYFAFTRRILRACARRVADKDIEALTGMVALRAELDAQIEQAVIGLSGDYSWAEIGRALGTTKQAAHMRFGQAVRDAREQAAAAVGQATA
jgi:hypothetical protein